jgi:hypothetical protein
MVDDDLAGVEGPAVSNVMAIMCRRSGTVQVLDRPRVRASLRSWARTLHPPTRPVEVADDSTLSYRCPVEKRSMTGRPAHAPGVARDLIRLLPGRQAMDTSR